MAVTIFDVCKLGPITVQCIVYPLSLIHICAVDKVIELPSLRFQQFSRALLADYDFIAENKNAIRHDEAARHCLCLLYTSYHLKYSCRTTAKEKKPSYSRHISMRP